MDIEISVDYKDNENETERNYEDKNQTDYEDLKDIDLKDNHLEITCNDTLFYLFQLLS